MKKGANFAVLFVDMYISLFFAARKEYQSNFNRYLQDLEKISKQEPVRSI